MARPRKYVDIAEVVRLRQLGLSWPSIAAKMRLGQGTVVRAHRAAGGVAQAFQNSATQPPEGSPGTRTRPRPSRRNRYQGDSR